MENKKPQSTPVPAKVPAQSASAKLKPSSVPAKAEEPKQAPQAKENKPALTKPTPPKQSTTPKPQSASVARVTQPIQKNPNVAVKAKAVKQPSAAKPQAPAAKAPAMQAAQKKPTTERKPAPMPKTAPEAKPAPAPKAIPEAKLTPAPKATSEAKPTPAPKAIPEAKPTLVPKATSEAKPAVQEQPKDPEAKADEKSTSAAIPVSKPSKLVSVATKGFVIQSWQIAVAVVIVVALVVGGILLGTVLNNQNTDDPIVDYTGPLVNKNPDALGNIALPGYGGIKFPANSKKVTLELPNPVGNPCYFRYTLTLVETDEVLYESELIEPGKMVKELTLNRALSQGTYTLRITIDTFSLADGTTPMNGGVQEVTVTVK